MTLKRVLAINGYGVFLQRRDELTLKVPETQEKGRTRMANQTVMDQHFKLLNVTVTKLGLDNAPAQTVTKQGLAAKKRVEQK